MQNEKKVEVEKCTEALSDEMQRAVLNCYDYICTTNGRKYGALRQVKLENFIELQWPDEVSCQAFEYIYRQPGKIIELIRKVFAEKISVENWRNYVQHVIKEEGRFKEMDNMVDDIVECRFLVKPFESSGDDIEELSDSDNDI